MVHHICGSIGINFSSIPVSTVSHFCCCISQIFGWS